MCQRLQKTMMQKEKLRESVKNVKYLQHRLKQTQANVPKIEKLKDKKQHYDPSQSALNSWIKENRVGKNLNGGKEIKFKMDLAVLNRKLDDFKIFRDAEKQAGREAIKRQLQNQQVKTEASIDIQIGKDFETMSPENAAEGKLMMQTPESVPNQGSPMIIREHGAKKSSLLQVPNKLGGESSLLQMNLK